MMRSPYAQMGVPIAIIKKAALSYMPIARFVSASQSVTGIPSTISLAQDKAKFFLFRLMYKRLPSGGISALDIFSCQKRARCMLNSISSPDIVNRAPERPKKVLKLSLRSSATRERTQSPQPSHNQKIASWNRGSINCSALWSYFGYHVKWNHTFSFLYRSFSQSLLEILGGLFVMRHPLFLNRNFTEVYQ